MHHPTEAAGVFWLSLQGTKQTASSEERCSEKAATEILMGLSDDPELQPFLFGLFLRLGAELELRRSGSSLGPSQ